jgi:hypothetical protein
MSVRPALLRLARVRVSLFAALCVVGCSGAQIVLASPISAQCKSAGLRGCDEITDGMILYAEGDRAGAEVKLKIGAAENSPANVKKFASVLELLRRVPGTDTYVAPVAEAVDFMARHAGSGESASGGSKAGKAREASTRVSVDTAASRSRHIRAEGTLTADTDPAQARHGVMAPPDDEDLRGYCTELSGADAHCELTVPGPMFVTDLISLGRDCRGQFVAIAQSARARVVLDGPFQIHGARLLVGEGEALIIGQRDAPEAASTGPQEEDLENLVLADEDPRYQCRVLWSGFQPYR